MARFQPQVPFPSPSPSETLASTLGVARLFTENLTNAMRVLITGGAGCLGSNLIENLLPKGCDILVIDNFATGKREVVPPVNGLKVRRKRSRWGFGKPLL